MLSIALVSLAKDHTYGDCYLLDGIFATCRESSSIVYRAGNGAWSYVGLPDLVIHSPWSLFLTHYLKAMGVGDDSSIYFKNYDHGFHSYFSLELLSGNISLVLAERTQMRVRRLYDGTTLFWRTDGLRSLYFNFGDELNSTFLRSTSAFLRLQSLARRPAFVYLFSCI